LQLGQPVSALNRISLMSERVDIGITARIGIMKSVLGHKNSRFFVATAIVAIASLMQSRLQAQTPREEIQRWIEELGSGKFAVRQRATMELKSAEVEAIPLIAAAAVPADAEVRSRTIEILLAQALSPRPELREAARKAIAELERADDSRRKPIAHAAFKRLHEALATAADAELTRLGATITPMIGGPPQTYSVQLGQNWAGGNERLSLLPDLGDVWWLSMESAPVSDTALTQVARLTGKNQPLKRIFLGNTGITGSGLPHLAPLNRLVYLSLKQLPIDNGRLATLPDFPELQFLGLDGTRVSDDGLKTVARYPRLQVLWLDDTAVTDAGLVHLKPLKILRTLSLPGTHAAGTGLAELRHLPLTTISLKGAKLNADSLKHVAQLEQLETLILDQTNVTDDQLADLIGMERLRNLGLCSTGVTDVGLEHLKSVRSLQALYLSETQVSSEGPAELRRTLPKCEVHMSGRTNLAQAGGLVPELPPAHP